MKLPLRAGGKGAPRKKVLWLHIGHYKTGTTALQVFLAQNRKALLRAGLDYPEQGQAHSKHSLLAFALYRAAGVETLMHGYAQPETPEEVWDALFDALRASPAPAGLVSSEEFMRLGAHPAAARRLAAIVARAPDIEFRVIAWLRAPQDHLRSWYNQLVKMGITVPGFDETVTRVMEPVHYDYACAVAPWIEIFGAEAVTLRGYRPEWRQGTGLYEDALAALGPGWPLRGAKLPGADPNPRLEESEAELVRLMQNAGFPKFSVIWARKRAEAMRARAAALETGTPQSFEAVAARAGEGLDRLAALPGCAADLDAFRADLPRPAGPREAALQDGLGLVLSELNHLRKTSQASEAALKRRIEALEARLGMEDGDGGGAR